MIQLFWSHLFPPVYVQWSLDMANNIHCLLCYPQGILIKSSLLARNPQNDYKECKLPIIYRTPCVEVDGRETIYYILIKGRGVYQVYIRIRCMTPSDCQLSVIIIMLPGHIIQVSEKFLSTSCLSWGALVSLPLRLGLIWRGNQYFNQKLQCQKGLKGLIVGRQVG